MKKSIYHKQKRLYKYFEKAGLSKDHYKRYHVGFLIMSFFISVVLAFPLVYYLDSTRKVIAGLIINFTFGVLINFFILFVFFYIYLDVLIYLRKNTIEKVLPEFLLLTSSNMKSGMLIDQALFHAAKPKFGILSYEIKHALKRVSAGHDLPKALLDFCKKYDSYVLSRSFDVIIEGIESGGKLAKITNQVSISLSDLALQKKETSASVSTYAIFISFAAIFASPVLLALAGQILEVIRDLISGVSQNSVSTSFMAFTPPVLTQEQFMIFSLVLLCISSAVSAMIVSVIKSGSIKKNAKLIPVYIIVSIGLYLISRKLMQYLFGGIIGG